MQMEDVFFLLPICDGTLLLVNAITFAFTFAPIATWIDPLPAFGSAFAFAFAAQCVYIFVQLLLH